MKRIINDVPLHQWKRVWYTPDGRYTIGQDNAARWECKRPHKMRSGRQCLGGQEHYYLAWSLKDTWTPDKTPTQHRTLKAAVAALKNKWLPDDLPPF